ncbi:MAG TPA: hypothetical protein VM716_15705 [Gemmatimonadales bacterium]|nr:hypothetical protein [Gemmatimonadales bacterium]
MRQLRYVARGLCLVALAACSDPLAVTNSNQPDRSRVFTNPADLEQFVSNIYVNVHQGTLGGATVLDGGANDALQPQLQVAGMENVSGLANFAMGPRGNIPRTGIANTRGSTGNQGDYRDWVVEHRAARMAVLAISALKQLTLGSPGRDARARAFARFGQGVALGNLALAYDSASILTETDNPQADAAVIVPLSGYAAVMTAALGYLDSAIAIATADPSGFPLPSTWINGNALTATQFIQLCHSYKARFRATVARTPAGQDTANWNAILADASPTTAITADLRITMLPPPAGGWDISWVIQAFATGSANWHQMSQFWMGMADTSGAADTTKGYDHWLNTAPSLRVPFLVVTPDRRFPQGTTRGTDPIKDVGTQVGNSPGPGGTNQRSPIPWDSVPYFRNRPPGEDQPGDPMGISQYDFYRSRAFNNASRNGPYPVMTVAEIRLYAAEAQLRLGNVGAAAALIDVTRVGKGRMKPLSGVITDSLMPVPGMDTLYVAGSRSCVPRVPDATAGYKRARCGRIWDALKWEYRMETAYAGYGMWFFAGRGWGDLPQYTALNWAVPYQEMDSRLEAFYGVGGAGGRDAAGPGTYGLFAGGVY